MFSLFLKRFWQPPRAHGEVIEDRTVSFLELFYDLVYVVVIAQAAHELAVHLTWRGVGEFATVFGLIWLAWLNGTTYHDLHGREDGRTRTYVFLQMLMLALLAVFTADAGGDGGRGFAIVYTVFLLLLFWMWYTVRRQDSAEYMRLTGQYLSGLAVSVVYMAGSAFLPDGVRTVSWAVFMVAWIGGWVSIERLARRQPDIAFEATDSLVERFGLFTIIVLGEVVVGVVSGLSEVERTVEAVATGMIGLGIGFGIWWTYFDYVGGRRPRPGPSGWMVSHLPITMAIAASGAAMIGLIEHAADDRAPAAAAWLLGGSVAVALVSLIAAMRELRDFERLPSVYRPLIPTMIGAAVVSLLVAWWRPAPWLLVLLVVAALSAVWWVAVDRWLRLEDPGSIRPDAA
ncbi:MAG: low temperature requirement protein A [Acidimicrobiia bacterium]|nr:low temperature requirement protein A [Acidimicrobiia bacterium]